jgi:hypothetical protein
MKDVFRAGRIVLFLLGICAPAMSQIVLPLDNLPAQIQCNEPWTNQSVVMYFTETGSGGGPCAFSIYPTFVIIAPAWLYLDFSSLTSSVIQIEADVDDGCGGDGCTWLYAFDDGNQIAEVENTTSSSSTIGLGFDGPYPDACAITSFEGSVHEVRLLLEGNLPALSITSQNGSIKVSWPATHAAFCLESSDSFSGFPVWQLEQASFHHGDSNVVHWNSNPSAGRIFRLRFAPDEDNDCVGIAP